MSAAPTRCCAPATSGRCSNAPAPYGQSRYIGVVEIAACNHPKHQAALRSLPDFTRRADVCGADDCGKPAPTGLCPEHRQQYQRHGVSIRALLATEPAPMTTTSEAQTPDVLDAAAKAWAALSQEERDKCLVAASMAAISAEDDAFAPPIEPQEAAGEGVTLIRASDYQTTGDLLSAIFGAPKPEPLPDGLAGLGARGQEPATPGPTLAEVQADLATCMSNIREANRLMQDAGCGTALSMPERVQLLIADRDHERERANEAQERLHDARIVITQERELLAEAQRNVRDLRAGNNAMAAEIMDVSTLLYTLGADVTATPRDALLQVLAALVPDVCRDVLQVEAAEHRATLARLKARRLNPAPPEKLAEYADKLAKVEAEIAAIQYRSGVGSMAD